jgi:predicted NUDIX family phosphoesterase
MSTQETTMEHVLVVPTLLFHELGHFQGFSPRVDPYLKILLDPTYTSYRPRDEMEVDPSYKQLIPYCVFRHEGRVFHYQRGTGQGEGRLHGKRSIGIGGHISAEDVNGESHVYEVGMRREIQEEVILEADFTETCIGMINDDLTEVGQVHLGIVHVFNLDRPKVRPREESIMNTGFAHPSELVAQIEQFETWSRYCLEYLASYQG